MWTLVPQTGKDLLIENRGLYQSKGGCPRESDRLAEHGTTGPPLDRAMLSTVCSSEILPSPSSFLV
jgi:hypothetical protein